MRRVAEIILMKKSRNGSMSGVIRELCERYTDLTPDEIDVDLLHERGAAAAGQSGGRGYFRVDLPCSDGVNAICRVGAVGKPFPPQPPL